MDGEPAANDAGHIWVGACFAGTEEEAGDDKGSEALHGPGEGGESGPPENDTGENATLPGAIAHHAGGDFKEAIGEDERAENDAPLFGGDVEVGLDAGTGDGDAEAVKKGDNRQQDEEGEDDVAFGHLEAAQDLASLLHGEGGAGEDGELGEGVA